MIMLLKITNNFVYCKICTIFASKNNLLYKNHEKIHR